uniref:NXPE C-terminal domain-containing protein n=1 Tax=Branchiostoma floridae TaxID=7739 RepID=C3XSE5_BRAFL|eukprot:XP_002613064.1 hypothetical protein BRAFLDRAFT_82210 [Branchiostoma floridae]
MIFDTTGKWPRRDKASTLVDKLPTTRFWCFREALLSRVYGLLGKTVVTEERVMASARMYAAFTLVTAVVVFLTTTYPTYTEVVVLNRDRLYRKGDVLTVKVVAIDKKRRPKPYGGDFFHTRLVSCDRSLQASSAGHVTDHCNGTYTVQFPLYWVGNVSIKIQLVHPSEAVKILQSVRQVPNKRDFHCTFVELTTKAYDTRQCFSSNNPSLPPHRRCDFSKWEANGTWICQKPEKLPCSAIAKCRWKKSDLSRVRDLVSQEEMKLFQKPYLEMELEVNPKEPIRILRQNCPHQNTFQRVPGTRASPELRWDIVQGSDWIDFDDSRYTVDELDATQGGPNTVVVLSLWAHFTAEPLDMIRSRLYAVGGAIHRLMRRSPDTQVFVRTGTTREHVKGKLEFYLLASDWLAYEITEVIREVFRADPDVVVLDTWDMSVCQPGKDNVHPDQTMVDNQLNRLFSHICPK